MADDEDQLKTASLSKSARERYQAHISVDNTERITQIISYMREKGIPEKRIQQQIQLFSSSSQKTSKNEEDKTLTVIFENRVAYRWLVSHPLIWAYENDVDGMRILTGLDYDRVQKIFDIEGFDAEELKEVITAARDVSENGNNDIDLQRDLFSRLMQIEIGAKAFFDYRLNKQREENERKLKSRR